MKWWKMCCKETMVRKPCFLHAKLLEFDLTISSTHSNYPRSLLSRGRVAALTPIAAGNQAGSRCFGHHLLGQRSDGLAEANLMRSDGLAEVTAAAGMNPNALQTQSPTRSDGFAVGRSCYNRHVNTVKNPKIGFCRFGLPLP